MEGIVRTPEVLGGEPRLEGRRISVRQIAELVIDGDTPVGEVADQLEVSRSDVHRALTYYYEHPEEMADVRERRRGALATLREDAIEPPETLTR